MKNVLIQAKQKLNFLSFDLSFKMDLFKNPLVFLPFITIFLILMTSTTLESQTPMLEAYINGVTVTSNNDGTDDVATITVCSGVTNNVSITTAFKDLNNVSSTIRIYQTKTTSNATLGFCHNCQALLSAFTAGTNTTASSPSSGTVMLSFQIWNDVNNNSAIDPGEPKGDLVRYTIIVNNSAGSPSSNPSLCINTPLSDINHTTTGATGINQDGVSGANGLPAGVTATWASNLITISGTPTTSGVFNYSIPLIGGCGTVNATGTITVDPLSVGGTLSPATSNVCPGTNSTSLTLSGHTGSIVKWQSSTSGDFTDAVDIGHNTVTYNADNLSTTQSYRAVIQSGSCTSAYSASALITVDPLSVGGTLSPTASNVCSGTNNTTLTLSGHTGPIVKWQSSALGDFSDAVDISNAADTYTATNLSTNQSYRAVIQSGSCTSAYSASALITVDPLSVGGTLSPAASNVCFGTNNTTLTLSGHTGSIIKWQSSTTGDFSDAVDIPNTADTYTATNLSTNQSYRVVVQSGSCTSAYSASALITVDPLSVGGTLSAAASNVCSGTNSTTLNLSGHTGSIVKWQSSTTGDFSDAVDIPNTADTYTATNLFTNQSYRVVVQNGSCTSAYSASALITVDPLSVGGTLSPTTTNVCSGSNNTTLIISGQTGNIVKWQSSEIGDFTDAVDIVNTTHTFTATGLISNRTYRVQVKSGSCPSIFSASATISVDPTSNGGLLTPSTSNVCIGTNSTTLSLSMHTGSIVKWQSSSIGDFSDAVDISNTTDTYTATNLTSSHSYRAIIKSGVCTSANSIPALINVLPNASIASISGASSICAGGNATFNTIATLGGGNGTWTSSNPGVATVDPVSGLVNGISSGTTNIIYTITGGCGGTQTAQQALTVNIAPFGAITGTSNATICAGNAASINMVLTNATSYTGIVKITDLSNSSSVNYTLSITTASSTSSTFAAVIPSTLLPNAGPANKSYLIEWYSLTMTGGCTSTAPSAFLTGSVTIEVKPVPTISATNITQNICTGQSITTVTFTNPNTIPGSTYNLDVTYPSGVTGNLSDGFGLPFGSLDDVIINNTTSSQTVKYSATPAGPNSPTPTCFGTPLIVTITVNPKPTVSNSSHPNPVCSDEVLGAPTFDTGSGIPVSGYFIQTINSNGLIQSSGAGSNDNLSDDSWTNTSSSTVDIIYTISPTGSFSCPGSSFTYTVSIKPEPIVTNQSTSLCSNIALDIDLDALIDGSGDTYSYTVSSSDQINVPAGAPRVSASNTNITDKYINKTSSNVTITYNITPHGANGCAGNSFSYIVTIEPEPAVTNGTHPSAICSDVAIGAPTYPISSGVPAVSFSIISVTLASGLSQSAGTLTSNDLSDDAFTNVGLTSLDVIYRVIPSDGTCVGDTFNYTVTINPEPAVANASHPSVICSDVAIGAPTYPTSSGVDATSFSIVSATPASGLSQSAGTLTSNDLSDDAFTNVGLTSLDVIYRVIPSDGTCVGDTFNYIVTINPEPAVTNGTHPSAICSDVAIGSPAYPTSSSVPATSFSIISVTPASGLSQSAGTLTSNDLSDDAFTNVGLTSLDVIYRVIPSDGTCVGDTFSYTVTINPEPAVANASHPAAICSDVAIGAPTYPTSSGVDATSFSIVSATPASGLSQSAGTLTSNDLSDDAFTNVGLTSLDVIYRVIPSDGTCVGDTFSYTVTINPEPAVANASHPSAICSDVAIGAPTYPTSSGVDATSFSIVSATLASGLSQSAGTLTSNDLSDDAFTNMGLTSLDVIYRVIPSDGTCVGDTFSYTVTINPEPAVANASHPSAICSDVAIGAPTYPTSSGVDATSFSIVSATPASGLSQSAGTLTSNDLSDDAFTNVGLTSLDVIYRVIPSDGTCVGDTFNYTVSINPEPNATPLSSIDVCSGSPFSFDLDNHILNAGTALGQVTYTYNIVKSPNLSVLSPDPSGTGSSSDGVISNNVSNFGSSAITLVYSLTPTSELGCIGSTFTTNVIIKLKPQVTINTNGDNSLCKGEQRSLSGITLPTGSFTYEWKYLNSNSGNATVSNATNANAIITAPTDNNNQLIVQFKSTNTSTSCADSANVTFNILDLPEFTPAPASLYKCENSSGSNNAVFDLSNSISSYTPSSANVSYHISLSDANAGIGAITNSTSYTGNNGQVIWVRLSANDCYDVKPVTLNVYPKPSVSISGTSLICNGASTTLTASGGSNYLWSNNATTAAITVSPATNSIYQVTVTNDQSCTNTASINVTVQSCTGPTPDLQVTYYVPQNTTFLPNESQNIIINLNEVGNLPTVGTIQLYVSPMAGYSFSFNTSLSSLPVIFPPSSSVTINNADWIAVPYFGGLLLTSNTSLSANANKKIAITVTSPGTASESLLTTIIFPGSGGDNNSNNNSIATSILTISSN